MTTARKQLEDIVRDGGFAAVVGCPECSGGGALPTSRGASVPCPICNASGVSTLKLLASLELLAKAIVVPGAHADDVPVDDPTIPDLTVADIPDRAVRRAIESDRNSVTAETPDFVPTENS